MDQGMASRAETEIAELMEAIGRRARAAAQALARTPSEAKDAALRAMAAALRADTDTILAENAKDVDNGRANGLSGALLDRLTLTPARIDGLAKGLEVIAGLKDPVGEVTAHWTVPNGLDIARVRVPLGVIGIIYESRPGVTADASALCLKSGNAVILRGGSEAFHTNHAVLASLVKGMAAHGLPEDAIQMVPTTDREAVGVMLRLSAWIDVIVPRGGKGLVERCQRESRIPLFMHLEGLCHTYIHAAADPEKAVKVTLNAKMRRPGICGATETLLVDRAVAPTLLPPVARALLDAGCELRGDPATRALVPEAREATAEDWDTEYLDAILSVRVVDGFDQALEHIRAHSSQHTEAIITEDRAAAERFLAELDSAILMHNASTQFADGGEFGMGAEIGISTGRMHARGPVGVEQLTTFKYQVRGEGQTRP